MKGPSYRAGWSSIDVASSKCDLWIPVRSSRHAASRRASAANRVPHLEDLSIEELMNVEITTASKTRERQSDAPAIVEVLTRDELNRFGGTTLADVLTRVPGLAAVSGYFTDHTMIGFPGDALQAPTSRHVLLLINGRPVREVQEGGIKTAMLEAFPIDAIDRIEVIKGPGSVLYGSEAFAGVINIITIKPERSGLSVGGMGGASAFGTAGTATIKDSDLSVVMAGKLLNQADWQTSYTFQKGTDVFSVNHTIPSNATGTYIGAQYKNLSVSATADQSVSSYFIPPFQVVGDARWRQFFADVGYVLTVRAGWTMNFNLTYNQSLFDVTSGTFPNITRNSREILGEWTSFVTLSEKSKIVFGGTMADTRGKESTLDTPAIVVSDGARSSFGGYVQADYQLLKSVKVIGGFQANKIGDSDVTVVPRAGLIWGLAPKVAVKALYGQAFRAPYINELHINHPGLLGNPNLKSEHVSSVDLEVSYSGADIELVAKYFDNRQTDSIIEVLLAGETRPHYENAGLANVSGVEFSGKRYVSKAFYLTGSLLYQTSDDGNGHTDISYGSNFGAKAGVSYSTDSGTVSLFDSYQGDVASRLHQTLNQPPGPYQMLALHGLLNINKALTLKSKHPIALILQGDNLLDEQLWVPALGNPATDTVPFNKGRATYLGLRVGF